MNTKTIFQILNILLSLAEQATNMIAETSIPEEQQPRMREEVDSAVNRLQAAKSKVAVNPE